MTPLFFFKYGKLYHINNGVAKRKDKYKSIVIMDSLERNKISLHCRRVLTTLTLTRRNDSYLCSFEEEMKAEVKRSLSSI